MTEEAAATRLERYRNAWHELPGVVALHDSLPDPAAPGTTVKTVAGGLLVQDRDFGRITRNDLKVVTKRAPV